MFNYRLFKYINKNQSLKYQIMVILMEEHRKARLGDNNHLGEYNGGTTLLFDPHSWKKMKNKISKSLSKAFVGNRDINDNHIMGLFADQNDYCKFEYIRKAPAPIGTSSIEETINESEQNNFKYIQFIITDNGYSYQYNGYRKSQDRLQDKANWIIGITFFYYIFSWIFKPLKIDFGEVLTLLFDTVSSLSIDFKSIPSITIISVVMIIIYDKYFK